MARAKRTDRADARRRYRQTVVANGASDTDEAVEGSAAGRPGQGAASSGAPARPSIGGAFRSAYRPADLRTDLQLLPSLLRTRGILLAIALVLVGGVAFLAFPASSVTVFVFQTLTLPPALAPVFLVGWLAPRASYLLGLVVGVVDLVVYAAVILARGPSAGVTTGALTELIVSAAVIGPMSGLLFAAAAAWYRRFLQLSGRPRQPARSSSRSRRR